MVSGCPCELTLPAIPAAARVARVHIRYWLDRQAWPPEPREAIEYAVSEAVSNVVEHAYPVGSAGATVLLTAEVEVCASGARRVRVRVSDSGCWRPLATEVGSRHHGIRLMNGYMDEVVINRGDGARAGTEVVLLSTAVPPAS